MTQAGETDSLSLYENTRQFAFFPAFSEDSDWLIPVTSCDVCLSAFRVTSLKLYTTYAAV